MRQVCPRLVLGMGAGEVDNDVAMWYALGGGVDAAMGRWRKLQASSVTSVRRNTATQPFRTSPTGCNLKCSCAQFAGHLQDANAMMQNPNHISHLTLTRSHRKRTYLKRPHLQTHFWNVTLRNRSTWNLPRKVTAPGNRRRLTNLASCCEIWIRFH